MSILNVVCPICTELFKNPDDIYSTSCGHIFHIACLNSWMGRGTSCPQCRHYNPTTHKIYLSFEDGNVDAKEMEELQLKLKSSNEKNAQLVDQMNETEFNFLHLQEQFTNCEREKKELEERIRQMNDSEDNFLNLQGQYTESSELIKELQFQIQQMSIENESKVKELRLKCMENESLLSRLQTGSNNSTDNIMSDRIRILESKLSHISAEFEKEIATSTQLSIEKMKLQSYIDHLNKDNNSKSILQKTDDNTKSILQKTDEKPNFAEKLSKQKKDRSNPTSGDSANRVLIRNLPKHQITFPLENVVLELALKMHLSISRDDLVKVNFLDDTQGFLSVQFKSKELKLKFLSNRNVLKNILSTSSIIISECMNDELRTLMTYAREKLRDNGFNHIFCKNNQVFAKKHRNHHKVVRIYNKACVDFLQNENKSLESEETVPANIDKNYYQL